MELGTPIVFEGAVRNGFIRKVYGILTAQLLLTTVIAFPISQMSPQWIEENREYATIAMVVSLVLALSTICCRNMAREVPYNYMFLLAFTICEAVLVGFICALYTAQSVLLAVALTAGIFFGLTAYAFTTKSDFTGMGPYLFGALLGLTLTSLLAVFFPFSPLMQTLQAGCGAMIFSMYIVYDTQLICGGKHQQQFGIDDYVFAALMIYLDIINLFLQLLELFGDRK